MDFRNRKNKDGLEKVKTMMEIISVWDIRKALLSKIGRLNAFHALRRSGENVCVG